MKIRDFFGLFTKHSYTLKRSYPAEDGCTVFELEKHPDVSWVSGQHGIFTIPNAEIDGVKWRAFSIASTKDEKNIVIATKIGGDPSSFKQAMDNLKPGDSINMRGPFGWFYLQDKISAAVMIAGGVGITPMRALFKEIEKENKRKVTLVYSARESYLFKDELDTIAERDANISIVYVHGKEDTQDAIKKAIREAGKNAYYYLSGTPGMITETKDLIKNNGISKKQIVTDEFKGY
jgi:ferredoxin-NADP reductase